MTYILSGIWYLGMMSCHTMLVFCPLGNTGGAKYQARGRLDYSIWLLISGFTPWISVALTGVYVVAAPSAGGSFRRRPAAYTYNSIMDEVCVLRIWGRE